MYYLTALYGQPDDAGQFDRYYATVHAELIRRMPGMRRLVTCHPLTLDGGPAPYYFMSRIAFDSDEALRVAIDSPEGKAAGADGPNLIDLSRVTLMITYDDGPATDRAPV